MPLKIIDLFCGAGGLSLGAARAGFEVAAGIELDSEAIATHRRNFPAVKHLQRDVSTLKGKSLLEEAGVMQGTLCGLIGGPPCQGFSEMGKRDPNDKRNELFTHFMRLVGETRPAFFLAENVPGITHESSKAFLKKALSKLPKDYKVLPPLEMRGDLCGAATTRRRIFFIGYDSKKCGSLNESTFQQMEAEITTVRQALFGLPSSVRAPDIDGMDIWRKVAPMPAGWFNERISGKIPAGLGDPMALRRFAKGNKVNGHVGVRHDAAVSARYGALTPGQRDPISRSVRLDWNGFCPTLRAGTGPEKGRRQAVRPIHPSLPRVITPREAARLQGFPDWFLLPPTKWHSFRQIGNSVSPLVAERVLNVLYEACLLKLASGTEAVMQAA